MKNYFSINVIFCLALPHYAHSTDVLLPLAPMGSTVYSLPGVYGAAGDTFYLQNSFNAPNGALPAVTMGGLGTFILNNGLAINQINGGASGVPGLRAVVLARAGGRIINYGTVTSIGSTAVDSFGMMATSLQTGLSPGSAFAYNYGTITMQGNSTDGMNATGTSAFRSYALNEGLITVSDNIGGTSGWVTGMSGVGNGSVVNGTNGVINATSNPGSRGSNGLFGGWNRPNYSGTNSFSTLDPQMLNLGIINSSGDTHGIYYWGGFQTFAQNDGVINILGRGHGFYFDNVESTGSGSVGTNSTSGIINTNNANSYGMYLRLSNNLVANNSGRIETTGARSHGVVAFSPGSSATNFSQGTIITNGDSAAGIYYSADALNDISHLWNQGTINVNGTNSFGIATPQSAFRNDGIINVNGANSFGMLAGGSYNLTVDPTIPNNTYLGGLTPLSANQGATQNVQNYGVINATAALTYGLAAQGAGSLAINEQSATINASLTGTGMFARNEAAVQNNGLIASDANSLAVSLDNGSLQNNGTILSNNIGVLGTNNSVINNAGTLRGRVNAVQFNTGNNVLNLLNGSTTIGTVLMGSGVDRTTVSEGANIAGVPLFDGNSGNSFLTFDGYQGAVNSVMNWQEVKSTQGARVLFNGSNNYASTLFSIDTDSTLGFDSQNGTLTGDVLNEGSLDYSAGNGTGRYFIQGTLTNAGETILAGVSNVAGNTLTVIGNFLGQNGFLSLNTFLNSDGSPSDLLILNGGAATGTTGLRINNTGGLGAFTFADGILVIDAINNATTTADAFYLATPAIAGPFEYRLYRSDLSGLNQNNWYLRNECPPGNPACSPEPEPSPSEYRSEVGLYPVLPAMTLLYGQTLIDTLHERQGQGDKNNRIWSRVIGLHGERERLRSRYPIRSSEYDYNFSIIQLGGEVLQKKTDKGWEHSLGVLGAVGQGKGDVTRPEFTLGTNKFSAFTLGSYWTLYTLQKAYIDTVLQATWYDRALSKSYRLPALKTQGVGFAASVEGGYPFTFKNSLTVEPQAQIIYQTIHLNDGRDIGATIHFKDINGTASRLGLRLARQWNNNEEEHIKAITAWIRPNYWYQFSGNSQAQFSSEYGFIPFRSQLQGSSAKLDLGVTLDLKQNLALYTNGSYSTGLNSHLTSYEGNLGLKILLS